MKIIGPVESNNSYMSHVVSIFTPRNHKDILKKVSARARATAREDGSKGGEKRTAQFKYKSCTTTFAKDLQNQRFRDSYVTYKISKKIITFCVTSRFVSIDQ